MKKRFLSAIVVLLILLGAVMSGCSQKNYIDKTSEKLTSYNIEGTLDTTEKTVTATQTVNYRNRTDTTLSEVKFHLYPNAFREAATVRPVGKTDLSNAYPYGQSWGKIDINMVKTNGKGQDFQVGGTDKNILTIPLAVELYPDENVELEINFKDFLPKMHHRYGYSENVYTLGNWYPIACVNEKGVWSEDPYYSNGDPFYSDMANYTVKLNYPSAFTPATTGVMTIVNDGKTATLTSNAKTVRDFAIVLSEKFKVKSAQAGNTMVNYFYFNDPNADANIQISKESVLTFNDLIGEYPYKVLNVVQTDFVYGGMEYPNLVYISSTLNADNQKQTIVHEIAHQWWYGLVGSNQIENAWMDEGLTEFSTALFFKKNPQYSTMNFNSIVKTAERNYVMFIDIIQSFNKTVDTTMNRKLDEYKTEQEYVYITYVKGMLLFDTLMQTMGERKFEKALKIYFNENKTQNATPEKMISSFQRAFGGNMEGFFTSWIDGTVIIG